MESRETLINMIRESTKVTAYAVEWFSDKFSPTETELRRALMSSEQTTKLIKELVAMDALAQQTQTR